MRPLLDSGHQSGLLAVILGAGIVYSNASMLWHVTDLLERKP